MRQPDLKDLAEQVIRRQQSTAAADRLRRILLRRQTDVENQLRANPRLRYAFDVQDAPLQPEPGEHISVVLAVRTSCGIVSSEMRIPREQFNISLFFESLENIQ